MWQPKQPASETVATLALRGSVIRADLSGAILDLSPDQPVVEVPRADRHGEALALADDAADRTDRGRHRVVADRGVGRREVRAVHRHAPMDAAPDIAEDTLAIDILRGPDAAPAAYAAVGVERDVGVRGVDRAAGFEPRKLGRLGHAEAIGHGLQFAIAAGLADGAEVVAFVEQHLDQVAAQGTEVVGLVLDRKAGGSGLGAGGDAAPAGLDGADPAAALMAQTFVVAEARDVDARRIGGLHDRLPGRGVDGDAIDGEGEGAVLHWL